MSRPPSVLTNAAAVPVFSVKGATASSSSDCSRSKSSVDSTTMPAMPWGREDVVVLERLESPSGHSLFGEYGVGCGVDFLELGGADELLEHGNMRVVCCVQSKAL